MAIYISGVRNLPEQVQKNKDDIEDLHTADTNLEAKIDQEIADRKALIEASGNATIIENPTEKVAVVLNETETNRIFSVSIDGTPKFSLDETSVLANEDTAVNGDLVVSGNIGGDSATISGNITANGDLQVANITASGDITTTGEISGGVITSTGDISGDNASLSGDITAGGDVVATGTITGDGVKGRYVNTNDIVADPDSDVIRFQAYAGGVAHTLEFDATNQNLTIDGNPVGGATPHLYRYDIFLIFTDTQSMGGSGSFILLSNTQLSITSSNVIEFLYTNYKDKQISCLVEFDGAYYSLLVIKGSSLANAYFEFNYGDNNTDAIDTINEFVCEETQIF